MILDLTTEPVGRTLLKMTAVTALGLLAILGFTLADAYFVGLLGKEFLASISYCFPLVALYAGIGVGIGMGAEAILARLEGEGEELQKRRFATNALLLALAVSLVLTGLGYWGSSVIPLWLGADDSVVGWVELYFRIWLVGAAPMIVALAGGALARALGDAVTPAVVMVVSSLVNLALDPLFIFGIDGLFPALGFEGAAYATLLSRILAFLWTLYLFVFRYRLFSVHLGSWRCIWKDWKEILRLGVPATMVQLLIPLGQAGVLKSLGIFSVGVIGAFGMAIQVDAMAFIFVMALNLVMAPFVGQNIGAKRFDRIWEALRLSRRWCAIYGVLLALCFLGGGRFFASLLHGDSTVVATMVFYLSWVPLSYAFEGVRMVMSAIFNSTGNSVPPMVMIFVKYFLVIVPLAYAFREDWGFEGVVFAITIANVVTGVAAVLWANRRLKTVQAKLSQ